METTMNTKKERIKLTPEQLFNVFVETSHAGAPIKEILQRHKLKPWELAEIRKKVRAGALESLAKNRKSGCNPQAVPLYEHQKVVKELEETKDALATVGYELSLLKKRVS